MIKMYDQRQLNEHNIGYKCYAECDVLLYIACSGEV